MEKHRILKKKIFVLGGILLAVLAALGGAWYLLYSQEASSEKDFKDMQRQTRTAASKIDTVEVKYELAQSSIERYSALNEKLINGELAITEKTISKLLRQLNELHRTSNLKLVIDNVSPLPIGGASNNSFFETEYTNINIEFDALSDLHALAFLQGIEEKLEGYLGMSSLSISRERQITRPVLQGFARGEKPRVVSTSVRYMWLGMNAIVKDADEVQSAQ